MSTQDRRERRIEMTMGRKGGFWTGVTAVLSAIVVIVLAVLFSALFLGLFVAIGIGLAVRAWWLGRGSPSRPEVIDAEYTVIDSGRSDRPPHP